MNGLVWLIALLLVSGVATAGPPPVGAVVWERKSIGSGGYGRVYRGVDSTGRTFARKIQKERWDVVRESKVLKKLKGYEGWPELQSVDLKRREIVMDWVPGVSLWDHAPRRSQAIVRIGMRLADYVDELQRRGFTHQDIKPDNLIINAQKDPKSLRLIDFGQAIAQTTRWNAESGTPEFRAPEQARPGVRSAVVDTFGIASTILFLHSGKYQFPKARRIAATSPKFAAMYAAPDGISDITSRGLRAVLARALSFDPKVRYQTPAALKRALAPFGS
jgi:serine/threonine-protein kinase